MHVHVYGLLHSISPSGAAGYTAAHNTVEVRLKPDQTKTGDVSEMISNSNVHFFMIVLFTHFQQITVNIKAE